MRYRCLVLDHDDTAVDSTATIHYPAFCLAMEQLRPGVRLSLDEYFDMNCVPGFFEYLRDELGLTEDEIRWEKEHWLSYVATRIPHFYDGMAQVIRTQKEAGGYVCVVSHSNAENIERDYRAASLPLPDLIYDGNRPADQVKPSPYPLRRIMEKLDLRPQDLLMIDDLTMGHGMAAQAGVDFAAAGWAHRAPLVRAYMAEHQIRVYDTPEELAALLF